MVKLTTQTTPIKKAQVQRNWHLIDAKNMVLGRLATKIATLLMGKHKGNYVEYLDSGDYVVVINAKDIKLTGNKEAKKQYQHYSGYPGGLKKTSYNKLIDKRPTEFIRLAVKGMLPKNKLQKKRITRLYIFKAADHNHADKFIK